MFVLVVFVFRYGSFVIFLRNCFEVKLLDLLKFTVLMGLYAFDMFGVRLLWLLLMVWGRCYLCCDFLFLVCVCMMDYLVGVMDVELLFYWTLICLWRDCELELVLFKVFDLCCVLIYRCGSVYVHYFIKLV
eukprot:gene2627-1625_t